MKHLIAAIAVLFSSQAMAAQYSVYVTGSTHVSPAQAELATLVQRNLLVDTSAKILRIELPAPCVAGQLCSQLIRTVDLNVTQATASRGSLKTIHAEGTFMLNNKATQAIVDLTLNANNAMDITITNSSDCKSNHSTFVGAPSAHATF